VHGREVSRQLANLKYRPGSFPAFGPNSFEGPKPFIANRASAIFSRGQKRQSASEPLVLRDGAFSASSA